MDVFLFYVELLVDHVPSPFLNQIIQLGRLQVSKGLFELTYLPLQFMEPVFFDIDQHVGLQLRFALLSHRVKFLALDVQDEIVPLLSMFQSCLVC